MRALIAAVLVLAGLYGGYWFVGSSAVESGLRGWLDQRQAEGWVANYSDVETVGFPSRFDTTISDLELADPRAGIDWSTPYLKLFALSYKPNHIIAALPNRQTFSTPYERIDITSDEMRGSVVFDPGPSLTLNRSTFVMRNFGLSSSLGWRATLESGQLATRQAVAKKNAHDIYFEAMRVRPAQAFLATFDPGGLLPPVFDRLQIDSTVSFDAPWDRYAVERRRPQITRLHLKRLKATWGSLDLEAAGTLDVDERGRPSGKISVRARNWRQMLELAKVNGVIPQGLETTVERALEFLAGMSGKPDTIDAPLIFANGGMSFGPIPIGPAPNLRLR